MMKGIVPPKNGVGKSSVSRVVGTSNAVGKGNKTGLDAKTYRDVLLDHPRKEEIGITNKFPPDEEGVDRVGKKTLLDFKIPVKDSEWLKCYMVGVIKNSLEYDFVQQALLNDGIEVKVSKCGVDFDSFVIIFKSVSVMEETWRNKREALCYWFDHLGPLLLNNVPHYFCSVLLYGVPLYCWHDSFFMALGNRWGTYVGLDEETLLKSRLDVAKMIIRIASPLEVPDKITVSFMGVPYCIKVKLGGRGEDQANFDPGVSMEKFTDVWSDSVSMESDKENGANGSKEIAPGVALVGGSGGVSHFDSARGQEFHGSTNEGVNFGTIPPGNMEINLDVDNKDEEINVVGRRSNQSDNVVDNNGSNLVIGGNGPTKSGPSKQQSSSLISDNSSELGPISSLLHLNHSSLSGNVPKADEFS
ncbi:hypothetical protein V6N13_020801 [Hibiscus sabdariffa]